ncbi:hypothetical protein CI15_01845 [Paraburkholderia monticola]|uniref:Uncharacterized protein n=1 Tax=Paraburkholderia monticola TaxID=1399968 RepID=A0A149Q2C0_9BURK|nr:hypothetical protein CI15_01845 [Paraburkholderia monticola]
MGRSVQDSVSEMPLWQFGGAQRFKGPGSADLAAWQRDRHMAPYPITVGLFGLSRDLVGRVP